MCRIKLSSHLHKLITILHFPTQVKAKQKQLRSGPACPFLPLAVTFVTPVESYCIDYLSRVHRIPCPSHLHANLLWILSGLLCLTCSLSLSFLFYLLHVVIRVSQNRAMWSSPLPAQNSSLAGVE